MRLGIMQPYFFPYLGYFDLIDAVDHLVVNDSAQYIKQGWINRNRIIKPTGGWQYMTVPVDKSSFHAGYRTPIVDVKVHDGRDWRSLIVRQLGRYRKKAPYFLETVNLVKSCLDTEERSIARLNVGILEEICEVLDIEFTHTLSSEIGSPMAPGLKAQDWVLAICEIFGASRYINLPGGRDLYDEQRFRDRGIELEFRNLPTFRYSCGDWEFVPNLSIIDVLMWNRPARVRDHLEMHR